MKSSLVSLFFSLSLISQASFGFNQADENLNRNSNFIFEIHHDKNSGADATFLATAIDENKTLNIVRCYEHHSSDCVSIAKFKKIEDREEVKKITEQIKKQEELNYLKVTAITTAAMYVAVPVVVSTTGVLFFYVTDQLLMISPAGSIILIAIGEAGFVLPETLKTVGNYVSHALGLNEDSKQAIRGLLDPKNTPVNNVMLSLGDFKKVEIQLNAIVTARTELKP